MFFHRLAGGHPGTAPRGVCDDPVSLHRRPDLAVPGHSQEVLSHGARLPLHRRQGLVRSSPSHVHIFILLMLLELDISVVSPQPWSAASLNQA